MFDLFILINILKAIYVFWIMQVMMNQFLGTKKQVISALQAYYQKLMIRLI